ncbi:MAG: hypothetical protein OEZ18_03865 [Candidatus Bathyarchaeota archaeon]|nr:hypothetical protein [Candidatus Bathyarchaeota archaeon]
MSRMVLTAILSEMQVWLNETEKEQLHQELLYYFGLIGATEECQALENAWRDPYNRQAIEEFIKAWLRRKRRKEAEAITGIV